MRALVLLKSAPPPRTPSPQLPAANTGTAPAFQIWLSRLLKLLLSQKKLRPPAPTPGSPKLRFTTFAPWESTLFTPATTSSKLAPGDSQSALLQTNTLAT